MPIAAFLPAIIGAAGSIGGALAGRHASGGSSGSSGSTPLLPPGLDQQGLLGTIGAQKGISDWFNTTGQSTFGGGMDQLKQIIPYYNTLFSGNRQAILEAAAPEIATINDQFNAPRTEAMLSGRGSALMPDLEAKRQAAISNYIFGVRPAAADKLTGIAQGLMSLGSSQVGAGADVLGRTAGELIDYNSVIRGLQARGAEQSSTMWGQLGTQLGGILSQIFHSGGGSGGSNPPILPSIYPPGVPVIRS